MNIDPILKGYTEAVLAQDIEALVSLYDDEARVFDLWSEWVYEGKAAWRKAIADWFGSVDGQKVAVEFDDVRSADSGELASVQAIITYRDLDAAGEETNAMQNRLTWVLQRIDGTWKIVHEHTSAPIDGETLKVTLKR